MAANNTKATMDELFKYQLAPKLGELVPRSSIIQKLTPKLSSVEKEGRKWLYPVMLADEGGVTYGDGTAFTYLASVAAEYDEAEVTSNPVVLKTRLSLAAANRMASSKTSFLNRMGLRGSVMQKSLAKRHEVSCLYGQVGIGTVSSETGSSGSRAVVLTDATWAPGIWAGTVGHTLDCYDTTLATNRAATTPMTVSSVDFANKTINITGTEADLANIVATDEFFFEGSLSNDMVGIDKIISTSTGTIFNINVATYELWRGHSHAVGGQLTFAKVMEGLSKAVAQGGLDEGSCLLVSPLTWAKLNSDVAALRAFDSSFEAKKADVGHESIEYFGQFGRLEVIAHPFVKEGEAFAFPKSKIRRIGTTDVGFVDRTSNGDYFEVLEGSAGYQILAQVEASIFIDCPAQCVKFTGITN